MGRVLILGAGVMGSALAVPAHANGHAVMLAATPLDADVLAALSSGRLHPRLGAPLPVAVCPVDAAALTPHDAAGADLVIVGVSSPGIDWAADALARLEVSAPVVIVTKGLVAGEAAPLTYVDALPAMMAARARPCPRLVGIGGPCIARELAEGRPTAVAYASRDAGAAAHARRVMATPAYGVALEADAVGVEACAALKNFYAIGVSAMIGAHSGPRGPAGNPLAAAFQRAVDEMALLVPWFGGRRETAYGLAGLGDLHVTVGGGRNARLGAALGEGAALADVLSGPMHGETVEGVDVGRVLGPALARARTAGRGPPERETPLARAILAAIGGAPFDLGAWAAAPAYAPEEAASP